MIGLLAATVGCSGGSGSGPSSSTYGSENQAAKGPCYEPIAFNDPFDPYAKRGTARFTSESTSSEVNLSELTCTTIRDAQGKALRYAASFVDKKANPMRYLVVTTNSYSGDGVVGSPGTELEFAL